MNINLSTFFEFPGILILIGIILLIIAIIIGLLAYRKVDQEDIAFSITEDEKEVVKEPAKEVTIVDEPNLVENNTKDINNQISTITPANEPVNVNIQVNEPVKEPIKEPTPVVEEIPVVENTYTYRPIESIVMPQSVEIPTETIITSVPSVPVEEEEIEIL